MRHSIWLASSLILLASVMLTGCSKPATGEQERKPPKVTVTKPVVKDVVDESYFTGEIRPKERVEIRARVEGVLDGVYFKDGDMVNKDTPMFLIEQAPYKASLAAARATKQQTIAARDLAKANLDRYQKLYDKKDGTVTLEEVQTKQAEYDAAVARILADDASIEQAEIKLGYTAIRAPLTGLMSERLVDPGNLVGAGENTLLATIVQMHPMDVYFDVSEDVVLKYLEKRRENAGPSGQPVEFYVGLKEEVGYPHKGELEYIDNEIDRSTGTAMVRGTIPNKQGFFYSGQFARIRVPLDPIKDAILVDEQALGTDLGGKYLLVVGDDNVVEQRPVKVGPLLNGMRVIREGLKPGERYILEGLQRARPGLPVTPQTPEEAKNETAAPTSEAKKDEENES
ncbi:MAG: efflux RND transporter periplasmic adaptor subunit [Pirellulales bacterium]|nr:efflux RND transporter periplasmic adaptor subunit [Pirellulales bacterium]